jgi:S1-C subfamily serine protease
MKIIKTLLIFNFLISITSGQAQVKDNWKMLFNEQFENNDNKWDIVNTTERKSEIISGKLIDEYNNKGYSIANIIATSFDDSKDYKIKFSIANLNYGYREKLKNIFPIYGFVWSFKDWDNYNYIIFQQGYYYNELVTFYKIGTEVGGNQIIHEDWRKSTYDLNTMTSFNEITIKKSKNELRFYQGDYDSYNAKYFASCPSEKWFSNICGIYIQSGAKVVLDYLTIEEAIPVDNSLSKTQSSMLASSGSGLILTANGYIVTNYHVIENASHIEVDVFNKGIKKTYMADVINSDKINDLSILKIRDENFKMNAVPFGIKSYGVKVGEDAFALGFPKIGLQGNEVKVTNGIISSNTGFQNDPTTFQISVPIQPGNSGGPLFDKSGNLIGITNAGITDGQNVGYAIKISYLLNFLETLTSVPDLPQQSSLIGKTLPQMVDILSPYTVLIRVNNVTIK